MLDSHSQLVHNRDNSEQRTPSVPNPHREVSAMKATDSVLRWRAWSARFTGRKIVHRPFSSEQLAVMDAALRERR
jgi:hypothetical protein